MASADPAPESPIEWSEAGELVMKDDVKSWRQLAHAMLSRDSIEEVLESAERERRRLEDEESRQRTPRQTQEEAIKELYQEINCFLMGCAQVTWALQLAALVLDCLGAPVLANAALLLLGLVLATFGFGLLIKAWTWVFQHLGI